MRRVYTSTIGIVALLFLLLAAGNVLGAGLQTHQSALASVSAGLPTGRDVPDGTRKLPPSPGTTKQAPPNNTPSQVCLAPVVNVSATAGNQSESFLVVNPTNTQNLVAFSNVENGNNIFRGYSMNGGSTWTRGTVATGAACCDGQAVFDTFGNLFLIYINGSVNQINLIYSTDGGASFSAPITVGTGSVDQPSIAVGNGSVWVDWNSSGNMVARGAPVTGLGTLGAFGVLQTIPSASGSFGGIAVGPGPNGGKVIVTYQNPTGGQGPATVFANVDADGLGAGGFGAQITVTATNVGGFDFIPAQSGRSVDAEAGVVWDSTGGANNNRIYLIYTEEPVNESSDTEIYVRTSVNDGTTWSAPVRVNDDPLGPIRSQFLPYITLDRSTGTVAAGWHDARNDNGVPGSGGTNNTPNDDSEYYASYSTDGGVTWAVNTRLSGGFSNAVAASDGVDYGDYVGQDAYGGKFYAMWADNANCDGSNPDGTLSRFDLYMNTLTLAGGGTPTSTVTGTPPTATRTSTATNTVPTATATQTVCATSYQIATATGTIVPGTTNTGSACDDCDTAVTIPFNYQLYGQSFSSVNLSSNGKAEFLTVNESGGYSNSCLPAAANLGPYDYTIFAYWDDQLTTGTCTGGCGIYTSVSGSAPNRIFNIEWRTTYFSGGGTANYELRLYEGQSKFDIVYGAVTQGNTSATSGVQRSTTNFTQYFCNGSGGAPTAGLVVTYTQTTCGSPLPTGTATSILPTFTTTSTSTSTPIASSTVTTVASATRTNTSVVGTGTATSILPTLTSTVAASATRTTTVAPTNTGIVPSATRTGTAATTPVASSTSTSIVATSTATVTVVTTQTTVAGTATSVASATSTVCPLSFTDVPADSTFYPFIRCLACRGIISGYNDGTFRPNNDITRGQIAKMVSNAAGFSEDPGPQLYEDVDQTNTFYVWINRLSNRGIMGGYPCGTIGPEPCISPANLPYFRPFANATRGQLAKIVSNAAQVGGSPTDLYYTDVPQDNPFYLWIMRLTNIGVMSGYPCGGPNEPCDDQQRPYFRPFSNVTRGQASKIVANTFLPGCETPLR